MQFTINYSFWKQRIRHIFTATVWLCWMGAAHATVLSHTGTFQQDDQRVIFSFTNPGSGPISLRTWSFGGGTNAAGDSVASGGFAPVVSLFDSTDMLIGLAQAGAAACGGNSDPATGFCWDVLLDMTLPAGDYLAVLTQDDNLPFGPFLSDGFLHDGEGNFTGGFMLITGDPRDGHWALDISLPGSSPIPEPGTLALLGVGLLALARLRRRA